MKKHIITVAGDLASGKGTVTKLLGDDLGYEIYRNGEYFRKLAKEKNMGVTEFNEYVTEHPEIDREIEFSASEYVNLYNVRKDDIDNYDFVIDSTDKTPLEVKELILLEYNNWLRERD